MTLPINNTPAITTPYSGGEESVALAQSYKVKLSEIVQYSETKNHVDLHGDFKLPCDKEAFVKNAQAFGFEYLGVDCAYVMTKVLAQGEHELWLAVEIHQYKDSWGLDAGEISWLYLKNEMVGDKLRITHLNLLPLGLFVDYESVEVINALNAIGAPFDLDIDFIGMHSRVILQKFSSLNSMIWLKELSTLGYVLSQYSQGKLQHPQTKIDIKNALTPYLLSVDENSYKVVSYLVQQDRDGVHNSLWLSHLVNQNNEIDLNQIIISFGQYASDLTICKAPSRNVVESSYFLSKERLGNGELDTWLELIGLESDEVEGCLSALNVALSNIFNEEFINRLMLRIDFPEKNGIVDVSELNIENLEEVKNALTDDFAFKGNQAMYFSVSSFAQLCYHPNKEYSLIEDAFQQPSFAVSDLGEEVELENEYDHKQPDFNEENKLEKLFSKPKSNFSPKQFNHHGKRSQTHHAHTQVSIDEKIEESEIKRASKYTKTPPLIRQKHRFKGIVHQAKQTEIIEHINNVQADLKESGQVDRFLDSISNLPKNPEHIMNLDANDLVELASKKSVAGDDMQKKRGRPPKNVVEVPPTVEVVAKTEDVEVAAAQEETPVVAPKPRGRPPKKVVAKTEDVEVAAAQEETPVATPKPRGRPPKKVVAKTEDVEVAAAQEETPVATPKPRGRPPKKVVAKTEDVEVAAAQEETPVATPKPRGRPPKKVVVKTEAVDVAAAQEEAPVVAPKPRGRPPKKVVEVSPTVEVVATKQREDVKAPESVSVEVQNDQKFIFGGFELSIADSIELIDTSTGAKAQYPLGLIKENPNYLFNSLLGYGVDKFDAVETLKSCGCDFAQYSFHDLQRRLMREDERKLIKYDGYENYILECEFEMDNRKSA